MAINLYGYNTQRISGITSGMDTESIVKNLLALEQTKIDKVFRQREKAQWQYDAYAEINESVSSLRNSMLTVAGSKSVVSNATYNNFKVNVSDNGALKITATDTANISNFQIKNVIAAKAAGMSSTANSRRVSVAGVNGQLNQASATAQREVAALAGIDQSTATIGDLASQFGLQSGENLAFSINGETFSFEQSATIEDVVSTVNASEKAAVTMQISPEGITSITSDKLGTASSIKLTNITGTAFGGSAQGFGVGQHNATASGALDASTTFADLAGYGFSFGSPNADGVYETSINGQAFTFRDTDSVMDVIDTINNSSAGVNITYSDTTGTFRIGNTASGASTLQVSGALFGKSSVLGVEEGSHSSTGSIMRSDTLAEAAGKLGQTLGKTLDVTINGKAFSFDTGETTLRQMMEKINNDPDAKAVFSYSEMTDTFSIASSETGANSSLSVSGLEVFGLDAARTPDADFTITEGSDAVLTLGDGRQVVQASNNFTLDGLKFEVYGDYNTDPALPQAAINVNVTQDYAATVDKFKAFVEEYNALVEKLNSYYYDTPDRDYFPLTEEERAGLSEKEAEQWDEKAKAGLLRNNSEIGRLLSNMRSALTRKTEGTGMSAFDLGISTTSWNNATWKKDTGKIELDEDKLLAALEQNAGAVQDVFAKLAIDSEGNYDNSINASGEAKSGLFYQISSFMTSFNSTIRYTNMQQTQTSINNYTTKMSDLYEKLSDQEEALWKKYSAMETALTQMQSQSNWLTQQLGLSTSNS